MRAICVLALFSFAVYWALWFPPLRRPAEVGFPSDEALCFSDNN